MLSTLDPRDPREVEVERLVGMAMWVNLIAKTCASGYVIGMYAYFSTYMTM